MKISPLAVSLSLAFSAGGALAQAALDKARATTVVNQVLSERGLQLQSGGEEGTQFKSQVFKFDSESKAHYQGTYTFTVVDGAIKVAVSDIKFASGMPTLFPVPGALLASLVNPMQARVQELLAGSPGAAGAGGSSGAAKGPSAKATEVIAGPAFNANGEPMTPSPNGLIPGRRPGERISPVIPASGDQLNQVDIGGLNLDMSAEQARKVLAGKAKWTERPLKTLVTTSYREQTFAVGNFSYRCAGAGACKLSNAVEAFTTYSMPEQPDLVGIHRVRVYGDKEKPLLNETIKALQEKYGKEMYHTPYEKMGYAPTYTMQWVTNIKGGVQGDFSGLGPVDQKSPTGCPITYFAEAPIPEWGSPKSFYSTGDIEKNIPLTNGNGFFKDVNRVLRHEKPQGGCGTLMGVVLTLDSNRDYVSKMEIGLLNYKRLETQLQTLANSFVQASNAARDEKQGQDKSRKADL